MVIYSDTSAFLRPMKRLIEKMVFLGFVSRCRLAVTPTRRSPSFANATTEGVVRPPSAFSITVGSPPSRTAMHEFVVPRSMPMVFAMFPGVLLESRQCEKSMSCYSRSFLASKCPDADLQGRVFRLAGSSQRHTGGDHMAAGPVGPGEPTMPQGGPPAGGPGGPGYAPGPPAPDQRFE